MLTAEEYIRYGRQLLLPELGVSGQEKLHNSRVLVIGAGGLGCPAMLYLNAAGVGTIGIVDFDVVDLTNLHRQVLYNTSHVGMAKARVAADLMTQQNPSTTINIHDCKLTTDNAIDIVSGYDVVVDGTDNFSTRYMINDVCAILGIPLVYGSIHRFQGSVSVFHHGTPAGSIDAGYRRLFPKPPDSGSLLSCSEIGVLGVLPGIVGTLQACEAIKIITGFGSVLSNSVLMINTRTMEFDTLLLPADSMPQPAQPQTADDFRRTNYEEFCGNQTIAPNIRSITANELSEWLLKDDTICFLDVREPFELPNPEQLTGIKIPLDDIAGRANTLPRSQPLVVYCQKGIRSKIAIRILQTNHGFTNLYNLEGGVAAWMQATEAQ